MEPRNNQGGNKTVTIIITIVIIILLVGAACALFVYHPQNGSGSQLNISVPQSSSTEQTQTNVSQPGTQCNKFDTAKDKNGKPLAGNKLVMIQSIKKGQAMILVKAPSKDVPNPKQTVALFPSGTDLSQFALNNGFSKTGHNETNTLYVQRFKSDAVALVMTEGDYTCKIVPADPGLKEGSGQNGTYVVNDHQFTDPSTGSIIP